LRIQINNWPLSAIAKGMLANYPPTAARRFETPDEFRAWLRQSQNASTLSV